MSLGLKLSESSKSLISSGVKVENDPKKHNREEGMAFVLNILNTFLYEQFNSIIHGAIESLSRGGSYSAQGIIHYYSDPWGEFLY